MWFFLFQIQSIHLVPCMLCPPYYSISLTLILLVLQLLFKKLHTDDFTPVFFSLDELTLSLIRLTLIIYFTCFCESCPQSELHLVHPHSVTTSTGMQLDAVYGEFEGTKRTWHHKLISAWTRRWIKGIGWPRFSLCDTWEFNHTRIQTGRGMKRQVVWTERH